MTKKEPKSDARLSEFDWHDLSSIFLVIMLLHNLKVFQNPIKHDLLAHCVGQGTERGHRKF